MHNQSRWEIWIRNTWLVRFLEVWASPLGLVLLVLTIWISSYSGRVTIHQNALEGCVRGQIQRAGDVELNDDLAAFIGLAHIRALRNGDEDIARGYKSLEDRAQQRAKANASVLVICSQANKSPKVLEFKVLTPKPVVAARRKFTPRPLPASVQRLLSSSR